MDSIMSTNLAAEYRQKTDVTNLASQLGEKGCFSHLPDNKEVTPETALRQLFSEMQKQVFETHETQPSTGKSEIAGVGESGDKYKHASLEFPKVATELLGTLSKSFPQEEYPFHNREHSIAVASRALRLAHIIGKSTNIAIPDEAYMAIILGSLAHDLVQESDLPKYLENNRKILGQIANGENPTIDSKKLDTTIRRQKGYNEYQSFENFQEMLEEYPNLKEILSELGYLKAIRDGIDATEPDFKIETISLPDGREVMGLNISQPKVDRLISNLSQKTPQAIVALVLPLADLPTSLSVMESNYEALAGGYREFRELHPNIKLIADILNLNLDHERLGNIVTEEIANTIIDSIMKWTESQAAIVMWQGEHIKKALERIGTNFSDSNARNQLIQQILGHNERANYAIGMHKKLKEILTNPRNTDGDYIEKLRLIMGFAGYNCLVDKTQTKLADILEIHDPTT